MIFQNVVEENISKVVDLYGNIKWRHDVFAPCHETLVFEVLITAIKKPNLFA
jgi:hypothetical protein